MDEKRAMVNKKHSKKLSITKQCKALNIHKSGLYYKPNGESALNLELMRLMDEHYLHHPFQGAKRMHTWLTMDKGYKVNQKRINRLYYQVMGLTAVMPGRHTSRRHKQHKIYPYLLRGLKVERPNQVWKTDIVYIPMAKGFMYMVAIIDVYSRYIVGWSISNTMDADWCAAVMQEAIEQYGKPEIINTDQGSQFTSEVFVQTVLSNGIKLSMDGKGRAIDNVHIERYWRSVKYEQVYLYPPEDGVQLYQDIAKYTQYYNYHRRHQGIENRKPVDLYNQKQQAA